MAYVGGPGGPAAIRPGAGNGRSERSGTSVSLAGVPAPWTRRTILAVILAGAAIIPGHASGSAAGPCSGPQCGLAGKVLWTRLLPGSWTASDTGGTVLAQGQAYAAAGGDVAAVGFGLTV